MKAATMYYDSYDSDSSQYQIVYVFSSIIGCAFWCTVIYCCVRGCRNTSEGPPIVQVVQQGVQQPEIHYIIHQDAMGPDGRPLPSVGADGRPIAYQQIQPGQFVP
ncbi:Aste57867_19766, partial [Globisporangium polare]